MNVLRRPIEPAVISGHSDSFKPNGGFRAESGRFIDRAKLVSEANDMLVARQGFRLALDSYYVLAETNAMQEG